MEVEKIKENLLAACHTFVDDKLKTIEDSINSNQKALSSETKSSAGDKHETGRAMLQLEMEKAGQQLKGVQEMKILLSKIAFDGPSEFVRLGSLVETSNGAYFIAVSAGVISLDGVSYFAVSPVSPIGKMLLGKAAKETVVFNGKEIQIKQLL